MRADVRQLFQGFTDGRLAYFDVSDLERRRAACEALGIMAPLPRRPERLRNTVEEAPPPSGPRLATFVSSVRGAGATSIAASAAELLAQEGWPCGAIDLTREADLARRLGAAPAQPHGGLEPIRSRCGVETVVARCEVDAAGDSRILARGWEQLSAALAHCALILADVPAEGILCDAACTAAADVVLVLRAADGEAALRVVSTWRAAVESRLHVLLNGFDPRRDGDRALRAASEAELGPTLLPFVVHEDAALRALPAGASLAEHGPESQALRDLGEVAAWLLRRQRTPRP